MAAKKTATKKTPARKTAGKKTAAKKKSAPAAAAAAASTEPPFQPTHVIDADLARVFATSAEKAPLLTLLGWGDEVELVSEAADGFNVRLPLFTRLPDGSVRPSTVDGFIKKPKKGPALLEVAKNKVLKVDFVDIQQGDASVIQTPQGRVILIDGGDNQLFARYLANRFRGSTAKAPRKIDCILVSHGDADHFLGLTELHKSETDKRLRDEQPWKQIFIHPERVYHNGLVKRPTKDIETLQQLGKSVPVNGENFIIGLEDDLLRDGLEPEMNAPFKAWRKALEGYRKRGPIEFVRLEKGSDSHFQFLEGENIEVKVLGPLTRQVDGKTALHFLGTPSNAPRLEEDGTLDVDKKKAGSPSVSHTINGHSVVLHLKYGNFRFLFAGDLNEEAEQNLLDEHKAGNLDLTADVFKVPHHGSADFNPDFLAAVAPVASVVSSGDETKKKEFIHPRANLMGALGRHSRIKEPLVFVTEMVAFFEVVGQCVPKEISLRGKAIKPENMPKTFFAFQRAAFGIVMVRTDGERLFIYTNSAMDKMKETYAFKLSAGKKVTPVEVRKL